MFCYKCGAENLDGVNYCQRCGTPLSQTQSQPVKTEQSTKTEQPAKTGEATLAFTDSCTKGCGNPVFFIIKVVFFAVVSYEIIYWLIWGGDSSATIWFPICLIFYFVLFAVKDKMKR